MMRMVDIITKKRNGEPLSTEEIEWLITGYTSGDVPDYQMAAWAMAVVWRGMDIRETTDLTLAMARSGAMLDLHDLAPIIGDKHSTGGIGDKTTLVLAPLVAAAGLPVAKMTGRGLGFTGGTVDKLESIPGLRTELPPDIFRGGLRDVGLVIAAQTADLAPADKRLYALRDVTATIESIPLIAASIMSKKLAAGADCIVLDIKYGSGSFMGPLEQARALADTMVGIGKQAGRRVSAVLSSMEQPLGYAIGNALEVVEVVQSLRERNAPADLLELCFQLGAQLLLLADKAPDEPAALRMLEQAYSSGTAWEKFREMVAYQQGDVSTLDAPQRLPRASVVVPLPAPQSGYIQAINGKALGDVVNRLGGGRTRKDDVIDPSVGLVLATRIGTAVEYGMPLVYIYAASESDAARVMPLLHAAYTFGDTAPPSPPLIAEVVT